MAVTRSSGGNASLALPGPETIHRQILSNGMTALVWENHASPSVVIEGYLRAGQVCEPAEKAGLAGFTATMLMRGTETRTFTEINEIIESVGASLNISAGRHVTGFSGKSLAEDLGLLLDVLADVLRRPTFPPEYVERVRGQTLTALQERDNDTRRQAALAFRELAYPPDHPYSRSGLGYQETITAITRDDLSTFYSNYYSPEGSIIVVVGAVRADQVFAQLEEALGGWTVSRRGREPTLPEVPPLSEIKGRKVVLPGKTQSDIVLGFPAIPRTHPDWFVASVANTVLGRFGMGGRLGDNVREKQGMAYYAYSTLEATNGPGAWMAIAGVNPVNVERAVESIVAEIKRICEEPIDENELADSQAFLTGSLPLRLETNQGVANTLLDMEWYGLGLDYVLRYPDLVNSVTPEQVLEVCRRYLKSDAYALAIAGPNETETT